VTEAGAAKRRQLRRRGFASAKEARQALHQVLVELDAGRFVAPDRTTTLATYVADVWLPMLDTRRRKPSTIESYRRNLRVHILPRLGNRPLCDIKPAELDRLYADLLVGVGCRRPLSPRTVRYVHTILHGIFAHAIKKEVLAANPCVRADPPEARMCRSREMRTWTAEQVRRFLAGLEGGDRYRAPLHLLATTGMRRGEALGLKWDDLDLDHYELVVRRTLGNVDYEITVGEPKTFAGRRTVALDAATVAVLREHRALQLRERLAAGSAYTDDGWVFTMADGRPMHPNAFYRVFLRRVAASGLPTIRLHDLRHTWATLALRAGVHPKIVQERIGHASIAITLDLYTHTDRDLHAAAAEAVAGLVSGRASTPLTGP
jgi:integrase